MTRLQLTVLLVACVALYAGCKNGDAPAERTPADPNAAALAEFNKRVEEYVALHKRVAAPLGEADDTKKPVEITGRETALAQAIRAERAQARPGDIFATPAAATLKKVIAATYRRSAEVRDTRQDAEAELPDFMPAVNDTYPPTHPLATFPATLLKILPELPRKLEYRIVTHHLILRDVEANLIVDVLPNAVP